MANIQHKNITDPNIHEPKGVALAAVDTVYVATGSGSGVWKKVDTTSTPYIECSFTGSLASSTATSANYPATFTTVTAGDAGITNNTNRLTVTKAGVYLINIDFSLTTQANAAEQVDVNVRLNKSISAQSVAGAFLKAVTAHEISNATATKEDVRSAAVKLNVGDELGFWITRVGVQPHSSGISGILNICRIGGI